VSDAAEAYRGALEAAERVLGRGGDADDVLRDVVRLVHERVPHLSWVGIAFVEEGELVLGPDAGERPDLEARGPALRGVPIAFRDSRVGELQVAGGDGDAEESAFLERVALIASPYCLVGWDTGGVPWSEVS
jgi:hypothetical protein